jgi:hypothetical protein
MMCPSCDLKVLKYVIHRFWDCPKAKAAWEWAFTILLRLHNPRKNEKDMELELERGLELFSQIF